MVRGNRRTGFAAIAILLTAGAGSAASHAEPPPPPEATAPGRIDQLIADLSSSDFLVRDGATLRLREDKTIGLAEIERILKERELPLEARARLATIARERFASSPRAAMGVQFDLLTLPNRVVIDDTIPPFDCSRKLEPGDIIIEADGVPLTTHAGRPTIQGLIISRDPGDVLKLVVRRGREKVAVDVRLGDFRDLRNSSLDEVRLYRAWKTRSREYLTADEDATVARVPVHADAWPDALQASRQQQIQKMRQQPANPTMVVHAGGRARSSNVINDSSWYSATLRGANGNRVNAWGANANALQMVLDFDDPNIRPPMTFAEEAERITLKRKALDTQLAREVEKFQRGERADVAKLEKQIRGIERQLEAITAEQQELEAAGAQKQSAAAPAGKN